MHIVTTYYLSECVTGDLHEVMSNAEHLQDLTNTQLLSAVSDIAKPDSQDLETYKPNANPWELAADVHTILPEFGRRIESYTFQKLFSEVARKMDLKTVSFWRAFQLVWSDVMKEWQSLCHKMISGTITLAETEHVFSLFRTEGGSYRYEEISRELLKLGGSDSKKWVDERIEQFSCFTTIKKHVEAASMLLKVKKAYDIQGDFEDIEKICNLVSVH